MANSSTRNCRWFLATKSSASSSKRELRSIASLLGDRVGVPWLGWTCGICEYCRSDRENLCDSARFTGYQIDGGYAELTVADQRYCFAIPSFFDDITAAPLLCAGLIGYRTCDWPATESGSAFTVSARRRIS